MAPHRLALIGAGTVGGSFLEALGSRAGDAGIDLVLLSDSDSVAIDRDGLEPETVLERKRRTGRVGSKMAALDALATTDVDILVDASPTTLGDAEPGFSYQSAAIDQGAHVVTANKGPVALRYGELTERADAAGVSIKLNATVGGGVPIIPVLEEVLEANDVLGVRGVLNGTCNFILTRMESEGLAYEHVLGEAQDMGVAEEDPSFDVDGIDTALKCAILANVIYGIDATLDDVDVTGITDITPKSLRLAEESGQVVRLVGEVTYDRLQVAPRLLPAGDVLDVAGTLNAVTIDADRSGALTLTGYGAGGPETASALIGDIIDLVRTDRETG